MIAYYVYKTESKDIVYSGQRDTYTINSISIPHGCSIFIADKLIKWLTNMSEVPGFPPE